MSTEALSAPLRAPARKRTVAVVVVAALAGAAIAVAVMLGSPGSPQTGDRVTELRADDFALAFPAGWNAVPAEQLAKLPGRPAAMVRRADGHGTVIVRRKAAPKDQSLRALTKDLTARLGKGFSDFRFVSSRVVPVRGGDAFLYTFLRTRSKVAQSIAIVRVGKTSFTLDAVAATGDERAAREVAAIVRSFGR
jgi:hypothetical protein